MEPDPDLITPDGDVEDAADAGDGNISWGHVDELADRIAEIPDGDKVSAKRLYRELAGG